MNNRMTIPGKNYAIAIGLFLLIGLTGCISSVEEPETSSPTDTDTVEEADTSSSQPEEDPESPTSEAAPTVEVSAYSSNELFDAGGGGCGMSLQAIDTDFWTDGLLFFNGVEGTALMKLDNEITELTQTAESGEEFYGQQISQSFETNDGAVSVDVDVTLGELGEIESVEIPDGTLTVTANGQSEEIAVEGDAGC